MLSLKKMVKWLILSAILMLSNQLFAASNNSTAGFISLEQIEQALGVPAGSSRIILDSPEISNFWMIDDRPEQIQLNWRHSEQEDKKECKILKIVSNGSGFGEMSFIHITVESEKGVFSYNDTAATDTTASYRYRVAVLEKDNSWSISQEIFTVPQPEIVLWWDYFDPVNNQYYVDGEADSLCVSEESLSSDYPDEWAADTIELTWTINNFDTVITQPANDPCFIIDIAESSFNEGDTIEYSVRSKDNEGNLSRKSHSLYAILDASPPGDVQNLKVTAPLNKDKTNGRMQVDWDEPPDSTGIAGYKIYRRIAGETEWNLREANLDTMTFQEPFASIGINKTVSYKIGVIDRLGNELLEDSIKSIDSAWCKIGPTISVPEYINTNSIPVKCTKFDKTHLKKYYILLNSELREYDTKLLTFSVPLDSPADPGEYRIQVQAVLDSLGKKVLSTWSAERIVEKIETPTPADFTVTNIQPDPADEPWAGHIYLNWKKPAAKYANGSYKIWRQDDNGNLTIIDTLSAPDSDSIKWIDRFDTTDASLKIFQNYRYAVQAVYPGDLVSDLTPKRTTYCNHAPLIVTPDFQYINASTTRLCIDNNWIDRLNPKYDLTNVSIQFKIKTDDSVDNLEWETAKSCFTLNLNDLEFDLKLHEGKTCSICAQARINDTTLSTWSPAVTAIIDTSGPESGGDFLVEPTLNADTTSGHMNISWPVATDSYSGVSYYRLHRKIGTVENFTLIPETAAWQETTYVDSFTAIGQSTTISYQLEAVDLVGNSGIIGASSARCLLGPTITLLPEVETDSVLVNCVNYDTEGLEGYNVLRRFDGSDTTIEITEKTTEFEVALPEPGEYQIRVQGRFVLSGKDYVSTWSAWHSVENTNNVPPPVGDLRVTNIRPETEEFSEYDSSAGHIYLEWTRPSENAVSYCISRWFDNETPTPIGNYIPESPGDIIRWVDRYDSNEILNMPGDTLCLFRWYKYKVEALNSSGASSEFSNVDLTFCNRAPEFITSEVIESVGNTKWKVTWRLPKINDDYFSNENIKFQLQLFTSDSVLVDNYDCNGDVHEYTWGVDRSKQYFSIIMASENKTAEQFETAWSAPIFCDYSEAIIPPVNTLQLQSQPGDSGIFVCYKKYMDHEFWQTHSPDMLAHFKIIHEHYVNNQIADIDTSTKPDTVTSFMDNNNLKPDHLYRYQVQPGQLLNDSTIIYRDDSIKKWATHDTGRGFIPKIDSIYTKNANNKLFFDGKNCTLQIKWSPRSTDMVSKNIDSLYAMIAPNDSFSPHADTGISLIDNPSINEIVFHEINTLEITNNKIAYLQITAYDKWNNKHSYFSTDWDGSMHLKNDARDPQQATPKNLTFTAHPGPQSGLVDVRLEWTCGNDNESGLKQYLILRKSTANNPPQLWKLVQTVPADFVTCYNTVKTTDIGLSDTIYYKVKCEDWVGYTKTNNNKIWSYQPIPIPQSFTVIRKNCFEIVANWEPVEGDGPISYIVEWHQDPNELGTRVSGMTDTVDTNQATIDRSNSESGTLTDELYFHILAFDADGNESGWSNIANVEKCTPLQLLNESDISTFDELIPENFQIGQNFPNPFNNSTHIHYSLPKSVYVKLKIFNLIGQEVVTLVAENQEPGYYSIKWNGRNSQEHDLPSGIYFYFLQAGPFQCTQKCVLMR